MTTIEIPDQRAIIDRRALAERINALAIENSAESARAEIVALLKEALDSGRDEIARRLEENPAQGYECVHGQSFLIDQVLRIVHDHVIEHVYPVANRSSAERLTITAVGGYGRAEMAPHSDVDIGFITPTRRAPWCEQVIEAMLYFLWDLGLKVGQSSRTVDDTLRMAREDLTIRTALLEGRFVWGDRALYEEVASRFWAEVVKGSERQFLSEKLEERNARHKRMGDSRYVVEPNIKDGKGGLRDLQTLYWIGKYVHRVRSAAELVDVGLLTRNEYRGFRRAENYLLAVRCHMHMLTGRAEDRLTFDLQRQVAERMNFQDRPGKSAVERFMQFYFLQAKRVGSLTGVFLAHIDDDFANKRAKSGFFAGWKQKSRVLRGYRVFGGRIAAPSDDWFKKDPVRLIELFKLAEEHSLEIHPETMRQANRDSALIKEEVRDDPRANALFLDLLAGRNDPEGTLRWMNEAGVFGRFVPDFGRVNAQMQFDMYHHYTVDEHTIRAIGLLSKIEKGELKADHPRSTRLIHKIASRRALYVAVLLHDIAKGRGGDHSVLGAEVAHELCPRFGLTDAETDLVAWLVLQHLLMSATAQKRDLTDPKTVEDFVSEVQSVERLRNLMVLDRGRHPRGRPRHLEQLEASADRRTLRSRAGTLAARPFAAWPRTPDRREEGSCRCIAGRAGVTGRGRRRSVRRCLLDRRARRRHHAQPRPVRGGTRERRAAFDCLRILRGARSHSRQCYRLGSSRLVLPHCRRDRAGRCKHHRRTHSYLTQRLGDGQFPRAGPARKSLP